MKIHLLVVIAYEMHFHSSKNTFSVLMLFYM